MLLCYAVLLFRYAVYGLYTCISCLYAYYYRSSRSEMSRVLNGTINENSPTVTTFGIIKTINVTGNKKNNTIHDGFSYQKSIDVSSLKDLHLNWAHTLPFNWFEQHWLEMFNVVPIFIDFLLKCVTCPKT